MCLVMYLTCTYLYACMHIHVACLVVLLVYPCVIVRVMWRWRPLFPSFKHTFCMCRCAHACVCLWMYMNMCVRVCMFFFFVTFTFSFDAIVILFFHEESNLPSSPSCCIQKTFCCVSVRSLCQTFVYKYYVYIYQIY